MTQNSRGIVIAQDQTRFHANRIHRLHMLVRQNHVEKLGGTIAVLAEHVQHGRHKMSRFSSFACQDIGALCHEHVYREILQAFCCNARLGVTLANCPPHCIQPGLFIPHCFERSLHQFNDGAAVQSQLRSPVVAVHPVASISETTDAPNLPEWVIRNYSINTPWFVQTSFKQRIVADVTVIAFSRVTRGTPCAKVFVAPMRKAQLVGAIFVIVCGGPSSVSTFARGVVCNTPPNVKVLLLLMRLLLLLSMPIQLLHRTIKLRKTRLAQLVCPLTLVDANPLANLDRTDPWMDGIHRTTR